MKSSKRREYENYSDFISLVEAEVESSFDLYLQVISNVFLFSLSILCI